MDFITDFLSGNSPLVYLFIFLGKLIEVTLAVLRNQLIIKGHRVPGAIVAALEYTFWLCITASAISGFSNNPVKIVVLVLAFALGQVLGSMLEEKLALGYCIMWGVFTDQETAYEAADKVRALGQAVTILQAEGIEGAIRPTLAMTIERKSLPKIRQLLFDVDPKVVISVHAVQQSNSRNFADVLK